MTQTTKHKDATVGQNHVIHNWAPSNTAARLAISDLTVLDEGKVARQNDGSMWVLVDHSTKRWRRLDGDGEVTLIDYGAAGDGVTDDSQAWEDALDAIDAAGGGILRVPEGTYNIPVSAMKEITNDIVIIGEGWQSVLDFDGAADVLNPQGSIVLKDLKIVGWSTSGGDRKLLNITEGATQRSHIHLLGCQFSGATDGYVLFSEQSDSLGSAASGAANVLIRDCLFATHATSVKIETYNLARVIVSNNEFLTLEENGVWLGRDYAASLNSFEAQGDYVFTGNIFKNIGDGSVQSTPERHAIILFGKRAVIVGNTIDHVENDTGSDCEGIYTKCTEVVISGNSLHDAGLGQAMIAQKGLPRADSQTPGYNTVISNNILRASSGIAAVSALSIGVGEAVIEGNIIDGLTDTAVVVGGAGDDDIVDVIFRGNRVVNISSNVALSFNCAGSRSILIEGNIFDGVDGGAGNAVGCQITNSHTNPYERVRIVGNTFRNMTSTAGTHVCGILDNMSQNPSVETFEIHGNKFEAVEHAIKFVAVAPRHDRLTIYENDMAGCTESGGDYVDGIANLITATTRFRANAGFATENSGTAAFSSDTSVVVTHGIKWTKRLDRGRVVLTPISSPPSDHLYITAGGATTFTINCDTPHTGNIGWQILEHVEAF